MTENKSKKPVWNKQDEQRYNALYTKIKDEFKDLNKDNYLDKINKKKLRQFISKLNLSISSKESYAFMISKWLKINKPNNTSITDFSNMGHKLMMERSKDYAENQLSEKKQKGYRDYKYFVDILNSINYKEIKTYRQHLQYLLLSLLIKQPPLRTSFYSSAEFHTKGGYDKQKNYIQLYTAGKPRVNYYVGKDKVSNSKTYKQDILKNYIEVEDKDLIELIYYSYEKYPRTYLFENNKKPIQDETVLRYLREITKVDSLDIDTMRSVYISHFYNNFNLTWKEKEVMASKMRNSPSVAQHKYLKVIEKTKTETAKDDRIKELEEQNKKLNEENEKLKQDLKDNKKEFEEYKGDFSKSDEWRKRRYDVIYKLNHNLQSSVKEATLDKYNIKYNEHKREYY